ncbi:fimbrillin family protein [Parabacteroides bouchesdurhonensis]|uniref:fimbrillin family protein n=1 Tax=Parabacteroides bouchesdurhonensis TaxID=1936995 RepID=UPI000C84762E|nr:fimbrillin family protein [Parabacteroides bouchesdurhonensis]
MNFKIYISALLISNCLACTNDNEDTQSKMSNLTPITFSGKITNITETKAILENSTIPDNAQIGIFAWGHNRNMANSDSTLRIDLNNSMYTKSAGNTLISTMEAHYPINADTVLNIYAYYPFQTGITDIHRISFNLNDQNDILTATPVINKGKESADQSVNLAFNHVLSAITLQIKKANDIKEDMILQSISLENYPATIQLDAVSGTTSAAVSTSNYTLTNNLNKAITTKTTTIVSNYLLHTITNPVFIVRLSNKDYRIESKKAFEAGKKQTYIFTIQANDISISATIKDWIDGGTTNEDIIY